MILVCLDYSNTRSVKTAIAPPSSILLRNNINKFNQFNLETNFPTEDFITILSFCPFNVTYEKGQFSPNTPLIPSTVSGVRDPRRQNPILNTAILSCSYDPTKTPTTQNCFKVAYFIIQGLVDTAFGGTNVGKTFYAPIADSQYLGDVTDVLPIDGNFTGGGSRNLAALIENTLDRLAPANNEQSITLTFDVGFLLNAVY